MPPFVGDDGHAAATGATGRDVVSPVARAPVVGVYRFWRDMGYAAGALIAGATADALGYGGAIALVAGLTAASGLWVLIDMPGGKL